MQSLGEELKKYFERLEKKTRRSRVYKPYQAAGLSLAAILDDQKHRALYIKIAKQFNDFDRLIALAKQVAERREIQNRGAYFMKVLKETGYFAKPKQTKD